MGLDVIKVYKYVRNEYLLWVICEKSLVIKGFIILYYFWCYFGFMFSVRICDIY